MKYYLIGSRALQKYKNRTLNSRCKPESDWDILVHSSESKAGVKLQLRSVYGPTLEIHHCDILFEAFKRAKGDGQRILNILFTLKASHVMFHKHHRAKTFYDLDMFSKIGCKIDRSLFFKLHEYWSEQFGEPWRADFSKESSDFFNDAVSREHQHDSLHLAVAKFEQPAFKYLQDPEQTTVWVSEEKFNNTTDEIRLQVIIEEAQVLALERDIIPGRCKAPHLSYINKVHDLIDRLAPLWMVPFICDNLNYFLTHHKTNFNEKINI